MSLGLPWSPFRFSPGSYHVMDCWARVVTSGMAREQAEFICHSANEFFPLRDALQTISERLDAEAVGEAEGNHIEIWERMHGVAVRALENAARPLRIAGDGE